MNHSFCHIEIPTTNLNKAVSFYKELFGWKIEIGAFPDYAMFETGEQPGGGIMKVEKIATPSGIGVVTYVLVEEVTDFLNKAKKLGGKIIKEKTEIPNMGWYGLFSDLDGNVFGLYMSK
jgi:predicted enzyme related to lactoylglutathione lyase